MKTIIFSALALTLALAWTSRAAADCCEHCGCQCECQKVCRLICETKKVSKVTYGCECEDVCVPGPSDHCVTYDECGCKKHVYTPTCATVRMRKKLVKHEEVKEVPSYRWVVENVCPACTRQTPPSMPAPSARRACAARRRQRRQRAAAVADSRGSDRRQKRRRGPVHRRAEAAHEPALNDALANRIMERACRRVPAKRRHPSLLWTVQGATAGLPSSSKSRVSATQSPVAPDAVNLCLPRFYRWHWRLASARRRHGMGCTGKMPVPPENVTVNGVPSHPWLGSDNSAPGATRWLVRQCRFRIVAPAAIRAKPPGVLRVDS